MKRILTMAGVLVFFAALLLSPAAYAGTGDVAITFYGQSCFKLESGGITILTDPWITFNPAAAQIPITVNDFPKVDLIFISHDHFDHVGDTYDATGQPIRAGDTIEIAKRTGAIVVAEYETAQKLIAEGLPPENVLFNGYGKPLGGPVNIPVNTNVITAISTPAVHSSDSGAAVGWILKFPGGATVYHAGDTGIFGDMLLYGALYPIDMALLPIGGYGTMDAMQAAQSLRLLMPRKAVPMHYGTFPMLAPNPDEFVAQAKRITPLVAVKVLQPGGTYILQH